MENLIHDSNKNIALFVNDFDQEYADALLKLSKRLGRPLKGVMLIDATVKEKGKFRPDLNHVFEEIVCDFKDTSALRAVCKKIENQVLLMACSSERAQTYFRMLIPFLPYVLGPTESSLYWATHKGKMREMLQSYDISLTPKVQQVSSASESELRKVLSSLNFPVIIKPTGLAGSLLVAKAHNEEELRQHLKESFKVIHDIYSRDFGRGDPGMIVEEFIEGDQYSVDSYVNEVGEVYNLPLLRSKPAHLFGLDGFYIYQTDNFLELSKEEIEAGHAAARKAIHALGLRSSVAHIELFHTKQGWKIVELGPRPGGQRQDLYFTAYGVDHAYNELLIKVGLEPEIKHEHQAYSMTVNVYAEEEGTISAIEGIEEIKQNGSVYKFTVYAKPGDVANLSGKGGKLVADGLLYNENKDKLLEDAAVIRSRIKVKTKK